ncbi:hypothetical protein [Gynuella sunshinyii]|uniref:Uncharacterized protein n=1 Tax=Gynuella sunshinyii YC6258 TaxID=1445510 RepID=A0A0C5VCV2_9GAMM|nr:hypothetical protein [Gynuella sunshinyii]AJQ92317.1 hypothetical Protein YC6258_00265 [Gynuella sunshinyii YC6258]
MANVTTIAFSDESAKLLTFLRETYGVSTNKVVIEKALKISAILADEAEGNTVVIQGRHGRTRLILDK